MQVGVVIECIGASVNVLWALDNAGRLVGVVIECNLNAFVFCSFLLSQLPKLLTSFLFFPVALSVSESASGLFFSAAVQSLTISFADG